MNKRIKKTIIILFWFAIWFCLAAAVNNKILLATPVQTAASFISLLGKSNFYLTVGRSLLRIGLGFLSGFSAAVLLAAGSRRFTLLEDMLSPVMTLIKAVPVASFVVLLLIWWGSSFLAVAICFLVVLPNIYFNTLEGLKNTDTRLLEMAEVFRLPFWNRFFYIYRPSLKPFLYGSMKNSLGMCWKSGVAAEVIGTPDYSIGERLYMSKIYLDTAGVLAWTAVIILLSILFEKLIMGLAERFFSWEPACRGQMAAVRDAFREKEKLNARDRRKQSAGSTEIRITDIVKQYNGQTVLEGISAVYEPGQTYYLTSPSGSGKTTLLRILAGLEMPDEGQCAVTCACSMVFQEDRLCDAYSAIKNVELVTGDTGRAQQALSLLLEKEALDKPCSQLSGGMKRRVALVRAMEAESAFVLLDEPFTGMDGVTRAAAEEYIRRRQNGRILIIATHI